MMPLPRLEFCILGLLALAVPSAQAAEPACDYRLTVHGAAASSLDISVGCADADLLSQLQFADARAADFVTRLGDLDNEAKFSIDLNGLAADMADDDGALRIGRSLIVSPASVLPVPVGGDVSLRLRVVLMDGSDMALGLPQDDQGRYLLRGADLRSAGEWVLGHFDRFAVPGEDGLDVAILDAPRAVSNVVLQGWVSDVAASNARFWGQVPTTPKLLAVLPESGGSGLPFGRVMAGSGATILLRLGANTTIDQLYEEWVLVHEFLHLGTPLMRDTGIWFNEGIATYFEPILRARAGWKNEDAVWHEWLTDMPRGLPALTETGLAQAASRRSYWGGALFLLLADVELRRRSGGDMGSEDCLRAVLREGVDVRWRWPTARMLAACDAATGATVFADLARRYVYGHEPLDLDGLWRDLGVSLEVDGTIVYDDQARLAAVRRTIVWGSTTDWPPIGAYRAAVN
jgi:hypothetical protein